MPSFIMIGWEMAEILHFEILRKHGQTHKQTDMGITIPRPPPMGGEVMINTTSRCLHRFTVHSNMHYYINIGHRLHTQYTQVA